MHSAINADHLLRGLALAIARNNVGAARPIHEVLAGEGITQTEYNEIAKNQQFLRYVDQYTSDLRENGFSFAAKSRVLAEDLLPTAYHMARDPDTPAAVRAKVLENLVEWGDLKPAKSSGTAVGAPGFSITINLPSPAGGTNASTSVTIDAEPVFAGEIAQLTPSEQRLIPVFAEPDDYEYAGEDYYV